jgi:hypothetical protein
MRLTLQPGSRMWILARGFDATIHSNHCWRCDLAGTAATTQAESIMKQCREQWQGAKSTGMTNGAT